MICRTLHLGGVNGEEEESTTALSTNTLFTRDWSCWKPAWNNWKSMATIETILKVKTYKNLKMKTVELIMQITRFLDKNPILFHYSPCTRTEISGEY